MGTYISGEYINTYANMRWKLGEGWNVRLAKDLNSWLTDEVEEELYVLEDDEYLEDYGKIYLLIAENEKQGWGLRIYLTVAEYDMWTGSADMSREELADHLMSNIAEYLDNLNRAGYSFGAYEKKCVQMDDEEWYGLLLTSGDDDKKIYTLQLKDYTRGTYVVNVEIETPSEEDIDKVVKLFKTCD